MKTRLLIILGTVIIITGFTTVVVFNSSTFSENNTVMKSDAEVLDEINQQAIIYQNKDQEKFDEQLNMMQERQKEIASKLLEINISKASVIKDWNFPFINASEIKPIDPEFKKPLCNIPDDIPAHLQAIRNSEMFRMFIEKYSDDHITFEISDERSTNGMIHYDLIATSDDGSFTASTYFHLDSCTNKMNWPYFLSCKDTRNDERISTKIKSEIMTSLENDEFCNIKFEPWHQDLRDYQTKISDELHRLAQGEIPVDSDGNPSYKFFSDFERLGLLNDIIRYYESDNSDHEKMQEDVTEYNRKFGSLPEELLKIIEQRK